MSQEASCLNIIVTRSMGIDDATSPKFDHREYQDICSNKSGSYGNRGESAKLRKNMPRDTLPPQELT